MVYTSLSDPLSNFSIICKNSLTKNISAARLDHLNSIGLSFSYLDRYSWFSNSGGSSQLVGPKISENINFLTKTTMDVSMFCIYCWWPVDLLQSISDPISEIQRFSSTFVEKSERFGLELDTVESQFSNVQGKQIIGLRNRDVRRNQV